MIVLLKNDRYSIARLVKDIKNDPELFLHLFRVAKEIKLREIVSEGVDDDTVLHLIQCFVDPKISLISEILALVVGDDARNKLVKELLAMEKDYLRGSYEDYFNDATALDDYHSKDEKGPLCSISDLLSDASEMNAATIVTNGAITWASCRDEESLEERLIAAVKCHEVEIVERILNIGVSVKVASEALLNAVGMDCRKPDSEMVRLLVKYGLYLDTKHSGSGDTALGCAAYGGGLTLEVFSELLKESFWYIDEKNNEGNTPLMLACLGVIRPEHGTKAHLLVIKKLLKSGANPHLINREGKNALDILSEGESCAAKGASKLLSEALLQPCFMATHAIYGNTWTHHQIEDPKTGKVHPSAADFPDENARKFFLFMHCVRERKNEIVQLPPELCDKIRGFFYTRTRCPHSGPGPEERKPPPQLEL
ncbi:MAG: ankyrin repeat domain-containing protein [Gammaproteobacteria bacterium]|nr:ankyrin repeat domain-containing protein [Gammaproteobacteria bacterium]